MNSTYSLFLQQDQWKKTSRWSQNRPFIEEAIWQQQSQLPHGGKTGLTALFFAKLTKWSKKAKHIHTGQLLKKRNKKKVIRKYASLTQAGAFQISTAGSIHFHIGGRGRVGVLANYSSRNDDGKYFEEIEDLVCLEMIWRGLDAEFKSRDFLMISSPPINWCVHNFLNILHPLSLVDFGWQLTFRKRILRCRVSSDHCVWSELFKHALKLLIGRWWNSKFFPFLWNQEVSVKNAKESEAPEAILI